jgi:hypothetical protein
MNRVMSMEVALIQCDGCFFCRDNEEGCVCKNPITPLYGTRLTHCIEFDPPTEKYLVLFTREFIGYRDYEHDDLGNAIYSDDNYSFYRLDRISEHSINRLRRALENDRKNRRYEREGRSWTTMTAKQAFRHVFPNDHDAFYIEMPETEEQCKRQIDASFERWYLNQISKRHEDQCIQFGAYDNTDIGCGTGELCELCAKVSKEYRR